MLLTKSRRLALALADDARSPTRLVLWDPSSGAEVPLPCLTSVTQVSLSGDPLGGGSPGWAAVSSQRLGEYAAKAFIWRPGDAAWTCLYDNQPTAGGLSVVFHGGRLFYTDLRGVLAAYDLNPGAPPAVAWMGYFGSQVSRLCRCEHKVHCVHETLLVSCAGDLLLVVLRGGRPGSRSGGRDRPPPPRSPSRGSPAACSSFADVYRMDWAPEKGPRVGERVADLGEHALFLGRGESFALSAKEFPAVRRNHIYCVARNWQRPREREHKLSDWAFVFDLGSDALEGIPYPQELRGADETNWWAYSWLCPRSPLMKQQQH